MECFSVIPTSSFLSNIYSESLCARDPAAHRAQGDCGVQGCPEAGNRDLIDALRGGQAGYTGGLSQVRLRLPTWPFLGAPLPAWGAGQSVPTDLATENSEGHPAPPKSQARAHPSRRGLGLYLVGRVSSQSWAQRPRRAVPPPPGCWRLAGICGPAF